ncbi:MAG: hypothetical protein C3F02_01690 [Parcubacteria group bacterium]|nr:MAG: hypothetical protein C3F02_01690 [Parcubacteria group bacterium]
MIIKNLKLNYSGRQDNKAIFKTENGAEVLVDAFLLDNFEDNHQPIYLALDQEPLVSRDEDKKEILNKLLNPEKDK